MTYDVSDMLSRGTNALGVMLGNGWYCEPGTLRYGDSPRLLLQMNIEYADGTSKVIKTDPSWKVAEGPITRNNLWGGETYDARQERKGWKEVGYDDSDWYGAITKSSPGGKMVSQIMPAIKVNQTIRPVLLTNPKPGIYVYDMGIFAELADDRSSGCSEVVGGEHRNGRHQLRIRSHPLPGAIGISSPGRNTAASLNLGTNHPAI